MKNKPSIKERLMKKTCAQLSAIYVRITGVNLLRGRKRERVNTLYSLLKASEDWKFISGSKNY